MFSILNILEFTFGLDLISSNLKLFFRLFLAQTNFFRNLQMNLRIKIKNYATIFEADFGAVWTQESHPTAWRLISSEKNFYLIWTKFIPSRWTYWTIWIQIFSIGSKWFQKTFCVDMVRRFEIIELCAPNSPSPQFLMQWLVFCQISTT